MPSGESKSKSSEGQHHQNVCLAQDKHLKEQTLVRQRTHAPRICPCPGLHSWSWPGRSENDNVKVLQLKSSKSNTL